MGIRVLIVDDHRMFAEGLRYVINAQPDLEVVGSAADGREALRQVKELKPDAVVMDISMPELNGIEATELILKRAPQVKIVILSMYSNHERVWRAFQAGARAYVLKKAAAKEVVDAVRSVREGGRFVSQGIAQVVIEDFLRNQPPTSTLDLLSSRERQVLQLLVEGKSSAVIAQTLFLSPKTVETYRSRMMQKLNIGNFPELVKFAIQQGLMSIE
jgi:DNA-binding NarL/FixJ family response regulator